MTKKLLAILISVVLVVSCMMVPAMAADSNAETPIIIEGEHFFNNTNANPDPIPETNAWSSHAGASNGYIYLNTWKSAGTYTHELTVEAPYTGYYDLEYIANSSRYGYSKIKFSVSGSDVSSNLLTSDETGTTNSGSNPYETLFNDAGLDMQLYTKEDVLLNEGTNIINVVIYNGTTRNAWAMDYIKFTPTGVRVDTTPFEVSGFEDNSVDVTCFSLYFTKPIADTTGIDVDAQDGTATLTIDGNKVKITGIAGRTTITVPKGFTGGRDDGNGLEEAYVTNVFAYPLVNTSGKSYPTTSDNMSNASIRKVGGYAGAQSVGMKSVQWQPVLAIYDGDKLIASKVGNKVDGAWAGSISLILEEGVKFTEAKIFALWNVDGEWIPLGKARSATAEALGFTFAE